MRVAILTAEMYEDVELLYPLYRLREDGHDVDLVGCEDARRIEGKRGTAVTTTASAHDADGRYDAVVIPGGYSPDHMRRCEPMVDLVRRMGAAGAPVAAICHGPWMLASADLLRDRTATGFHSIRDDVVNAGATWVDEEAVRDGNVLTSRSPDDLPAFMRSFLDMLEEA